MPMRFYGGPADGKELTIHRTPIILRVTIGKDGAVDCLNELDDVARPDETISVYRLHGHPTRGIMCSRGRGGGCKPYIDGDYDWLETPAADDATMRDNALWAAWCEANRAILLPAWMGGSRCE